MVEAGAQFLVLSDKPHIDISHVYMRSKMSLRWPFFGLGTHKPSLAAVLWELHVFTWVVRRIQPLGLWLSEDYM